MTGEEWFSDDMVASEQRGAKPFSCTGVVISESVRPFKIERTGEVADYYFLSIQPTSYTGKAIERKVRLSKHQRSKWVAFLQAMKASMAACGHKYQRCGDAVGFEFRWEEKVLGVIRGQPPETGTIRVLLPVQVVKVPPSPAPLPGEDIKKRILGLLESGPKTIEELAVATGQPMEEILAPLSVLISVRAIRPAPGGKFGL